MAYKIPWADAPAWIQSVKLDDRLFFLIARYNTESARWNLDILTADKEPIISGIRLEKRVWLLDAYRDDRLPAGDLMIAGQQEPDYQGMISGDVELYYLTPDETQEYV
jgi:hypothetical protein